MKLKNILIASLVIAASTQAHAAITIDQSQPNGDSYLSAFYQGSLAQSFSTPYNNVAGAGIDIINYGSFAPYSVFIGLWDKLPNVAGAKLLAGSSVSVSGNGWVDTFWSPTAVTPGATYYLVFGGPSGYDKGGLAGTVYDSYVHGNAFANAGYLSYPNDYAFRTYTDAPVPGSVPEPATWAMLLLGFFGLGAMRRMRRKPEGTFATA